VIGAARWTVAHWLEPAREAGGKGRLGQVMDRRVRELVLISLLAAFCGGLAWDHDQKFFAAAFGAAAVVAGFEARPRKK